MRIARQVVEKKIREPVSGEVRGVVHARGEYQPRGIDALSARALLQVAARGWVVVEEPEQARRQVLEQAHPDSEEGRRYLVAVVKRAEDECRVWQARFRSEE